MTTGSKKVVENFLPSAGMNWATKVPALTGLKGLKTFPNQSFHKLLNAKIVALRKTTGEESRLLVVHWFWTI